MWKYKNKNNKKLYRAPFFLWEARALKKLENDSNDIVKGAGKEGEDSGWAWATAFVPSIVTCRNKYEKLFDEIGKKFLYSKPNSFRAAAGDDAAEYLQDLYSRIKAAIAEFSPLVSPVTGMQASRLSFVDQSQVKRARAKPAEFAKPV